MEPQLKKHIKRCPHCQRLPLPEPSREEKVFALQAQATAIFNRLYCFKENTFTIDNVKTILEAFGHKSVISGKNGDLTLAKINDNMPLALDNMILVTVAECFIGMFPESAKENAKQIASKIVLNIDPPSSPTKRKRSLLEDENTLVMVSDEEIEYKAKNGSPHNSVSSSKSDLPEDDDSCSESDSIDSSD